MRQKRYYGLLILMLGSLLFAGCQEAPYELTKEEEALIVSYSSHIVSKYNIYQEKGFTHVAEKEEMIFPSDREESTEQETESINNESSQEVAGGSTEDSKNAIEGTLSTVFEEIGLAISYEGYEIVNSYIDSSSYAIKPSAGKNLLILHVNVKNETETPIELHNFGSGTSYGAKFLMDSEKWYSAPSIISLASNEFSTYEGSVGGNQTVDMILLFEVPSEITEVKNLVLKITLKILS